jgi:hypothetical protein
MENHISANRGSKWPYIGTVDDGLHELEDRFQVRSATCVLNPKVVTFRSEMAKDIFDGTTLTTHTRSSVVGRDRADQIKAASILAELFG